MVQDLATQWIQSYPCKTKTSQESEKCLWKFLEPSLKPKGIYTENFLEFKKILWRSIMSTPHRSETKWHWKEPHEVRKKELQQYCYNQHWMKSGRLILWNAIAICEMSKTSWQMENSPYSFWSNGWISPDFNRRSIKTSSIWQESFTRNHSKVWRWEFGKETLLLRISRNWKRWTHQKFILGESMRKKYWCHKREKISSSQ